MWTKIPPQNTVLEASLFQCSVHVFQGFSLTMYKTTNYMVEGGVKQAWRKKLFLEKGKET